MKDSIVVYTNPAEQASWETLGVPLELPILLLVLMVLGIWRIGKSIKNVIPNRIVSEQSYEETCDHQSLSCNTNGNVVCDGCGKVVEK